MNPSRRNFLQDIAALGASASSLFSLLNPGAVMAQTSGLRLRASEKNMFFGAASSSARLRSDMAYRAAMSQECGIITPEYEMKWDRLRPNPNSYYFADADEIVDFARQSGALVHGHTLCWHRSLPSWFSSVVTPANAERYLREHIAAVVGRYRGQIHSWDVVNEVVEPFDNQPNHLRNSPWYWHLGERYIEIAFREAAAADPSAMLVYNEYGVEFDDDARRSAILGVIRRLQANAVPIHALGIQGHMRAADGQKFQANMNSFRRFLNDVAALGLKIIITEFDCDDRALPANIQQRDEGVGRMYGDYCSVVMNNPAVIGFITWGISDKYTELNASARRPDGQNQRPLPLDAAMQRKNAWYALEWWFSQTSVRAPRVVSSAHAADAPASLRVHCAPNPASEFTVIRLQLDAPTHLRLSVLDAQGREIAILADGMVTAGEYSAQWNVASQASGAYICVARVGGGEIATQQILVHR
jgi:endo-1,4-beta-xylanase